MTMQLQFYNVYTCNYIFNYAGSSVHIHAFFNVGMVCIVYIYIHDSSCTCSLICDWTEGIQENQLLTINY